MATNEYYENATDSEDIGGKPDTSASDSDLMPCPFCGSENAGFEEIKDHSGHTLWFRVMCQKCTARSQMGGDKEKATANWNERAK